MVDVPLDSDDWKAFSEEQNRIPQKLLLTSEGRSEFCFAVKNTEVRSWSQLWAVARINALLRLGYLSRIGSGTLDDFTKIRLPFFRR